MRWLRLSRTGRWLAVLQGAELELVDLPGSMPNRMVPVAASDVAFVGKNLWMLAGSAVERISPIDLSPLLPRALVPGQPERLLAGHGSPE